MNNEKEREEKQLGVKRKEKSEAKMKRRSKITEQKRKE